MKLYIIDDEYIDYLSKFDNLIALNKSKTRPYVGIVLRINNISYFAPLYSPKPVHNTYKDNPSFIKIKNGELGIIRFSTMIPVPEECIQLLDINKQEDRYKRLLNKQVLFIREYEKEIYHRALVTYNGVTKRTNKFLINISCDFKILEKYYKNYKK